MQMLIGLSKLFKNRKKMKEFLLWMNKAVNFFIIYESYSIKSILRESSAKTFKILNRNSTSIFIAPKKSVPHEFLFLINEFVCSKCVL